MASRSTTFEALYGGPEEPYPVYEFENKTFMSNHQDGGIYDKPVSIVNGVTTHLPDPDLHL